jgi:SPP1 gp7 family putative phage head morphogenesis protein
MKHDSIDPVVDATYSLAMMKMRAGGVSAFDVIRVLQDEWGLPRLEIAKADDDEDHSKAGSHGIDEIARAEKAYYDALTAGQKKAHDAVKTLVEQLHAANKGWEGVDPWEIDEPIDEWKRNAFQEIALHPARAYLLGQMLASEKLKEPLHRPLLPTDGRAIEFLQHYTFNEIDSSFEDLKGDLRAALIDGIGNGENPKEVARKIANELDDYNTQWHVVAITETARAESQGRLRELADADEKYCIGSTAHDIRACDDCLALIDGKTYKISDILGVSNYGIKRANWKPCIPLHPRCRCVWLPALKAEIHL